MSNCHNWPNLAECSLNVLENSSFHSPVPFVQGFINQVQMSHQSCYVRWRFKLNPLNIQTHNFFYYCSQRPPTKANGSQNTLLMGYLFILRDPSPCFRRSIYHLRISWRDIFVASVNSIAKPKMLDDSLIEWISLVWLKGSWPFERDKGP